MIKIITKTKLLYSNLNLNTGEISLVHEPEEWYYRVTQSDRMWFQYRLRGE